MRPPGSNFGRNAPPVPVAKERIPIRTHSDRTKLRMKIQSAAIQYPRSAHQTEAEYAEVLAKIMRSNGCDEDQFDLAILIDKQLYGKLHVRR